MQPLDFPQPVVTLRPAAEALAKGVRLSLMHGSELSPIDVARVLNAGNVRWMLIGAHAINIFTGRPRATQDVDIVTDAPVKARAVLERAFPKFEVEDHPVVLRFKLAGEEVLDVIKASSDRLFRRVVRMSKPVVVQDVTLYVPVLAAALAMTFGSMVSGTRRARDRHQDARDFIAVAELAVQVDEELLTELGELVYAGGGKELLKIYMDARAGRPLEL